MKRWRRAFSTLIVTAKPSTARSTSLAESAGRAPANATTSSSSGPRSTCGLPSYSMVGLMLTAGRLASVV